MTKQFAYFLLIVLAGLAGGALVQICRPVSKTSVPIYPVNGGQEKIIQENKALKDAIQKRTGSVLGVKTVKADKKIMVGSGFILTSDGLAVTLADLVPEKGQSSFFIDGQSVSAQVLRRDTEENLALVKIDKDGLSTAGFFMIDQLKSGERVFLISQKFDKNNAIPGFLVDEGIVKSFDSRSIKTNMGEDTVSGAPVFDIEGNAVGLSYIYEGSVMVLPIDRIQAFVKL